MADLNIFSKKGFAYLVLKVKPKGTFTVR